MSKTKIEFDRRLTLKEAFESIEVFEFSEDEQNRDITEFFGPNDPYAIIRDHKHGDQVFDVAMDFGHDNRAVIFRRTDTETGFVENIPLRALRVINPHLYNEYMLTESEIKKRQRQQRNQT